MWATGGKVALARLDNKDGALPEPLLAEVRAQAERVDREITDLNERQSVIYSAGSMLARAGLLDESDALMTRELKRSHSPYYYMLALASNAKKRNTPQAMPPRSTGRGRAMKLRSAPRRGLNGARSYVRYLIDLAPQDATQIEKAAASVIGELRTSPAHFQAAASARSSA